MADNKSEIEDKVIFEMLEKARNYPNLFIGAENKVKDLIDERNHLIHQYQTRKVITNDETNSMIWLIKQNNQKLKAVLHII